MRDVDFKQVQGIEGIAKNFYSSPDFIKVVLDAPDQEVFYKEIKIPKRNIKKRGGYRVVYKGSSQMAQLQKNIGTAIERAVSLPVYVQGFVKSRSTVSNAEQHLARKLLLKADIKDFFDSITIERILPVFVALGCDTDTAQILARLCTLNGVLRQGLHTSPVLSNLVVKDLDIDLNALASQYSAVYTRYGDDIAISSNTQLPTKEELYTRFAKHGFSPNEEKFRIAKRGQPQYVTGLSVFDSAYPRIPKPMKRRLRLHLHYINKYGLFEHFNRLGIPDFAQSYYYNKLKGTLDYMNAVEPNLAAKMRPLLPRIAETSPADEAAAEEAARSYFEER